MKFVLSVLQKAKTFISQRRTSYAWLFVFVAAVFIAGNGFKLLVQQFGVLAWKVMLVGIAVAIAHAIRRQIFHYVDLSEQAFGNSTGGGLIFLGIAIFYSAIILALTQGL